MKPTKLCLCLLGVVLSVVVGSQIVAADGRTDSWHVLIFSKTLGYRHASITNGIAAIRELGERNSFAVEATEDSRAFTATNLARFQAVVFLSATGDILDSAQEQSFQNYLRGGGGFVAIHGAVFGPSACEDQWTWYAGAFNCAFSNHSRVVPATVNLEDANHPSTRGLPAKWKRTDEWYNFTGTPRGTARVLAVVDEGTYSGGQWVATIRSPGVAGSAKVGCGTPRWGTPRAVSASRIFSSTCSAEFKPRWAESILISRRTPSPDTTASAELGFLRQTFVEALQFPHRI